MHSPNNGNFVKFVPLYPWTLLLRAVGRTTRTDKQANKKSIFRQAKFKIYYIAGDQMKTHKPTNENEYKWSLKGTSKRDISGKRSDTNSFMVSVAGQ